MKRWIYSYQYVQGSPEALERTLVEHGVELLWSLAGSTEDERAGDGSFRLQLESDVAHVLLAKWIRVKVGVAFRDRARVVLPIEWYAEPGRALFPTFRGAFEWEGLSRTAGQLTLAGSYEIPLGVLGLAADASLFRHVAHRTADRLVHGLGRLLEQRTTDVWPSAAAPADRSPLRVRDVMTAAPLVLDESMPMRTAALLLFNAEIGGAPVVSAQGELLGVLSEANLLPKEAGKHLDWGFGADAEYRQSAAVTVGEACTRPARVTSPDSLLAAAAGEMVRADVSRLVVVDGGAVVGIVSRHDVLRALIRDDRVLLADVRRYLQPVAAGDVEASVEWGRVVLRGSVGLRSTAETLTRRAQRIEGVHDVDARGLTWDEDDIPSLPPLIPM